MAYKFILTLLISSYISVFNQVFCQEGNQDQKLPEELTVKEQYMVIDYENDIFNKTDEDAKYVNNSESLPCFIANHLNYPEKALENGTQGYILLKFVIEKDGSINNITVTSKKLGYGCEEEAIRIIKLTSGSWKPAKINGQYVRSYFRLPFRFHLD